MKDVLETLKKLPPLCYAVMGDEVVQIRRGAVVPTPAFGCAHNTVDSANAALGVTPQQVQAMLVGVTLGWDMDGADPDTHAKDLGSEPGPYLYDFVGTVEVRVQVGAHTEEQALKDAREAILGMSWSGQWSLTHIDLIDTTDPK